MNNNLIDIEDLRLRYSNSKINVLDGFSYRFEKSKITSILGKNGAGKTTLLDYLVGFKNDIFISNQNYEQDLRISYIIQNSSSSLFDWLSPLENIIYPTQYSNLEQKTIVEAVELSQQFNANWNWNTLTGNLSGGQKQKLAIIRAIFNKPELLLIDEGFIALDYQFRIETIIKLREWAKLHGVTIINVSHHVEEAILFSDEVVYMENGKKSFSLDIELGKSRRSTMSKDDRFGSYIQQILSKTGL